MSGVPKDRLWRVPEVATVQTEDGDHLVTPEDGELERAMLDSLALLVRYGGTVIVSADRTDRTLWDDDVEFSASDERWEVEAIEPEERRWETVGLVFRHAGHVPPMPRPRQVAYAQPALLEEPEGEAPMLSDAAVAAYLAQRGMTVVPANGQAAAGPAPLEVERPELPTEQRPAPGLAAEVIDGAPAPPG